MQQIRDKYSSVFGLILGN